MFCPDGAGDHNEGKEQEAKGDRSVADQVQALFFRDVLRCEGAGGQLLPDQKQRQYI